MYIRNVYTMWNIADKSKNMDDQLLTLEAENRRLQDELIHIHESNNELLEKEIHQDGNAG